MRKNHPLVPRHFSRATFFSRRIGFFMVARRRSRVHVSNDRCPTCKAGKNRFAIYDPRLERLEVLGFHCTSFSVCWALLGLLVVSWLSLLTVNRHQL